MKRRFLGIVAVVISTLVVVIAVFYAKNARFTLEPEYYGTAEIQTIEIGELQTLADEQKSFGLFVSQPSCQASADLEKYLNEFLNTHPLKFYEISFSTLKGSDIVPDLRFYPSFVIFRDGKVVDFLEANSDEDADAYTSPDGFTNWFSNYVELHI